MHRPPTPLQTSVVNPWTRDRPGVADILAEIVRVREKNRCARSHDNVR